MKFRAADISELEQLRVLEQKVVDAERPYNSSIREVGAYYYDLEYLISSDDALMLVVEDEGIIVATGYARIRNSKQSLSHEFDSYLGFMYVSPNYRGKGLNKAVVEHLISWSKGKGVNDFYLDVYSENTAAIRAYIKAGFKSSIVEMKLSV